MSHRQAQAAAASCSGAQVSIFKTTAWHVMHVLPAKPAPLHRRMGTPLHVLARYCRLAPRWQQLPNWVFAIMMNKFLVTNLSLHSHAHYTLSLRMCLGDKN